MTRSTEVIAGEFAEKLELKSFPFDCQELSVTLCLGVPLGLELGALSSTQGVDPALLESTSSAPKWASNHRFIRV